MVDSVEGVVSRYREGILGAIDYGVDACATNFFCRAVLPAARTCRMKRGNRDGGATSVSEGQRTQHRCKWEKIRAEDWRRDKGADKGLRTRRDV